MRIKALEALLKSLRVNFPDKLPLKKISKYQLGVRVGQQDAIRFIENHLKKEREKGK
jgi:hypothetical protein